MQTPFYSCCIHLVYCFYCTVLNSIFFDFLLIGCIYELKSQNFCFSISLLYCPNNRFSRVSCTF